MSNQKISLKFAKPLNWNVYRNRNPTVFNSRLVGQPFCRSSQSVSGRIIFEGSNNEREGSGPTRDGRIVQFVYHNIFKPIASDHFYIKGCQIVSRASFRSSVGITNDRNSDIFRREILRVYRKRQTHVQRDTGNQGKDLQDSKVPTSGMTSGTSDAASVEPSAPKSSSPAQHKALVVGRTKPPQPDPKADMDASNPESKAALNNAIDENVKSNTREAAPADETSQQLSSTKKKEKAPKQSKPPKSAPTAAPLSPALLDLRVGHILRAINHPNADSLYVSTIAMGDPEGTEHTSVDEETGKIVRTVCSGLNGLVPLSEMQNRKVVVVANLKPVNMRSIKSAAMVLAASPPAPEGSDPHAADRVVELVSPPDSADAGDKVFFEGWPYGDGKGPEKQLNPKKKQWEAIQPGFFTSDDCVVGFDSSRSELAGTEKGELVVEGGKGKCTVKSLKGAVVR